ncbi:trypsin-like serine protease [Streptomyces sp. NBC_00236]|uniref:trypsin-like serine protease n=1 Tax=Streptomyces sp. NBC_00236 TaxID=2903639 RepID=UPI002E2D08AF|nr:trypsin-like serine protease [Streptomyces sp. NBC_00236]
MPKRNPRTSWTIGLLTTSVAACLLSSAPAVAISGDTVKTGDYAFTVKLDIANGERSCSGALVDPVWVLTAASCFADGTGQIPSGYVPDGITVTAGGPSTVPLPVTAASVVPHPDRDLAMVRLYSMTPFSNDPAFQVAPIAVASTPVTVGEDIRVTGYGRTKTQWVTDAAHTATPTLTAVDETTLSLSGTAADTAGICKGDAGGPTFRMKADGTPELVGIHSRSWGAGCYNSDETRDGAVDTRIDNVDSWIRQTRLTNVAHLTTKTVTSADFNGDGRTDVAAVLTDGTLHAFYTGPGGALEYGRPLWKDGTWKTFSRIIGGDFNGDGRGDVAAMSSDGQFYLYPGSANGYLGTRIPMWKDTSWKAVRHIARYKADASGRDGLISVWEDGSLYAYTSGPSGALTGDKRNMWHDSTWGGKTHFATADFNADGRDDIAAVNSTGRLDLYAANTSGSFAPARQMWHDNSWSAMEAIAGGDFNGDGKGDLVGYWYLTGPVMYPKNNFSLYRGDGTGALALGTTLWPAGS